MVHGAKSMPSTSGALKTVVMGQTGIKHGAFLKTMPQITSVLLKLAVHAEEET